MVSDPPDGIPISVGSFPHVLGIVNYNICVDGDNGQQDHILTSGSIS